MKKCFLLCRVKQDVLDFTEKTFEKCFYMLLFRRKKKFMYNDIKIKVESLNKYGYHRQCYKKVIALKNKYKAEFDYFCKTQAIPKFSLRCSEKGSSTATEHFAKPSTSAFEEQHNPLELDEKPDISILTEDDDCKKPIEQLATTLQTAPSSEAINKKTACIFCGYMEKKVGKHKRTFAIFPQSEDTVHTIKEIAESLEDYILLKKLENNQPVAYHANCLALYKSSSKRLHKEYSEEGHWHVNRQLHRSAFSAICEVVSKEIIENQHPMFLIDLLSQYKALLLELGGSQVTAEDFRDYRAENLENKIMSCFADRIIIQPYSGVYRRKIVYAFDMDPVKLAREIANLEASPKNRYKDTAYELRKSIMSLQSPKLQADLTKDEAVHEECNIPEVLFNFISDLVQGPDIRSKNSSKDLVKIKSVCSDLIYIVSKGNIKPPKHVTLGLKLKSMTDSRKVLTILNEYGHSIDYKLAEEIETGVTCTQKDTNADLNNFDRFDDPATRKHTIGDTSGNIYKFGHEIREEYNNIDIEFLDVNSK